MFPYSVPHPGVIGAHGLAKRNAHSSALRLHQPRVNQCWQVSERPYCGR